MYVRQMPFEIFSASFAPVQTCWPFHATTVAVPVSWQKGSSNCAETTALRRSVVAMNRSFCDAPGSDRMDATCRWCFGRRRKETSRIASCARTVRAFGSTTRTVLPPNLAFFTYPFGPARSRYLVSSGPLRERIRVDEDVLLRRGGPLRGLFLRGHRSPLQRGNYPTPEWRL